MKNNFWLVYTNHFILKNVSKNKIIKTKQKNIFINLKMLNYNFWVYNGHTFINIKLIEDMINYRLGEFILTRVVKIK